LRFAVDVRDRGSTAAETANQKKKKRWEKKKRKRGRELGLPSYFSWFSTVVLSEFENFLTPPAALRRRRS
jgi:hypothetical protein